MDKSYGGIAWTNHAIQRMLERDIKQGDAWATWRSPDQTKYAKTKGAWIYYRKYKRETIEVVARKNDKGEWVVLSVWSKPSRMVEGGVSKFLLKGLLRFFK